MSRLKRILFMASSILFFAIILSIYGAIEYYGWQVIKNVFTAANPKTLAWVYWGISISFFVLFMLYRPVLHRYLPKEVGTYFGVAFVILMLSKLVAVLFLFPEDMVRLVKYASAKFNGTPVAAGGLSRSEFLSKSALLAASIPAGTLIYGALVNAYKYQYHKVTVKFPNLPDAFNGFKIIQLSDIHSGSFTKTEPIIEAIEHINKLNADVIFFTGDLVNNVASEMDNYMHIFDKLKAKHGVISVTGNHDYGDYVQWESKEEKVANFNQFMGVHKKMGWKLLMDEHHLIEKDGQHIAVIGIQNWGGKGNFPKYGKLDKAYKGTEEIPFKILLSHDPSHWDAQVTTEYKDIDIAFAGHTHGAQFGVENKWLKWSPSQYMYKQWAGLYNEGKQYLYVNRGFGFLGYPGRVGILPEIAEITLVKG